MKKLGNRIWPLIFFSLAANVGNIIFFPVMFYSSFQTVFDLTNAQMGNLTAAYASLAVPGYLISGWVADKFNSKKLM
ncbi:MAG: MFS transporter, partial [Hungatella sp.]